jgi:hypothetical protein
MWLWPHHHQQVGHELLHACRHLQSLSEECAERKLVDHSSHADDAHASALRRGLNRLTDGSGSIHLEPKCLLDPFARGEEAVTVRLEPNRIGCTRTNEQ